ncbi:MAG: hypothetical protein K2Y08_07740 [Alphaproteobacteria bacterium]|nr:hypothetical protein [Alphaproteobacteria bacterium]
MNVINQKTLFLCVLMTSSMIRGAFATEVDNDKIENVPVKVLKRNNEDQSHDAKRIKLEENERNEEEFLRLIKEYKETHPLELASVFQNVNRFSKCIGISDDLKAKSLILKTEMMSKGDGTMQDLEGASRILSNAKKSHEWVFDSFDKEIFKDCLNQMKAGIETKKSKILQQFNYFSLVETPNVPAEQPVLRSRDNYDSNIYDTSDED